jgi:hypothetical protein
MRVLSKGEKQRKAGGLIYKTVSVSAVSWCPRERPSNVLPVDLPGEVEQQLVKEPLEEIDFTSAFMVFLDDPASPSCSIMSRNTERCMIQ